MLSPFKIRLIKFLGNLTGGIINSFLVTGILSLVIYLVTGEWMSLIRSIQFLGGFVLWYCSRGVYSFLKETYSIFKENRRNRFGEPMPIPNEDIAMTVAEYQEYMSQNH